MLSTIVRMAALSELGSMLFVVVGAFQFTRLSVLVLIVMFVLVPVVVSVLVPCAVPSVAVMGAVPRCGVLPPIPAVVVIKPVSVPVPFSEEDVVAFPVEIGRAHV